MRKRRKELNVGRKIRDLRKMHRVRQKKLAQMVGLSPGGLTNFEKGRRQISLGWLKKISEALDTPMAYFLDNPRTKNKIDAGDPREKGLIDAWRRLRNNVLRNNVLREDFLRLMGRLGDLRGIRKPKR